MNEDRIAAIEKEVSELKRQTCKLDNTDHNNEIIKLLRTRIRELEDEVGMLQDQLSQSAVIMRVYICKTGIERAEESKHNCYKERPECIRIPLSTIRFAGLAPCRLDEISPQSMNSIVNQIEEEIRNRMIISVSL